MPGDRFLNMAATLSPTPFVPATLDHPDGVVTSRCLLVAYSSFPAWWPGGQPWRSCFGRMAAYSDPPARLCSWLYVDPGGPGLLYRPHPGVADH